MFRTIQVQVLQAQIGMCAVTQADRAGGAGDFLHRHQMGQVAHAGAAEFLGNGDAEQTHVAHLAPEIGRKQIVAVDIRGPGRDFGFRETPHAVAQGVQILTESGQCHGINRRGGRGSAARAGPDVADAACRWR